MEYERITIECSDHDGSLKKLIAYLGINGNSGHSFSIVVDPDDSERRKTFGWDGDGSDRIVSINNEKVEKWSKKYFTKDSKGVNKMSKVYDPVMCMMVEEKVKAKDAKVEDAKFKVIFEAESGTIEHTVIAQDEKDAREKAYEILRSKKTYFDVIEVKKMKDTKDVKSKDAKVEDIKSIKVYAKRNGYELGLNDSNVIYLAFPGETVKNPHMYLGRLSQENLTKGKQMFEKFAKAKDTKDAILGHVKEAAKILGISENDLEDRGYEKGYELVGHKKTGAILAKKNIRSGKMIVYKERMTEDGASGSRIDSFNVGADKYELIGWVHDNDYFSITIYKNNDEIKSWQFYNKKEMSQHLAKAKNEFGMLKKSFGSKVKDAKTKDWTLISKGALASFDQNEYCFIVERFEQYAIGLTGAIRSLTVYVKSKDKGWPTLADAKAAAQSKGFKNYSKKGKADEGYGSVGAERMVVSFAKISKYESIVAKSNYARWTTARTFDSKAKDASEPKRTRFGEPIYEVKFTGSTIKAVSGEMVGKTGKIISDKDGRIRIKFDSGYEMTVPKSDLDRHYIIIANPRDYRELQRR